MLPGKFLTSDGYRLGQWLQVQRSTWTSLTLDRKERLESLPGWVLDVIAEKWETGFRHVRHYVESEGHCKIPKKFLSSDGYRVGQWLQVQRSTWSSLAPDRKDRLRELAGWSDPA